MGRDSSLGDVPDGHGPSLAYSEDLTMLKAALWTVATIAALAGGSSAYQLVSASPQRANCPGRIVCPITGEEVCRDRCPLVEAGRPDCPGRIECPLTGELVCRDHCPLNRAKSKLAGGTPRCCLGAK